MQPDYRLRYHQKQAKSNMPIGHQNMPHRHMPNRHDILTNRHTAVKLIRMSTDLAALQSRLVTIKTNYEAEIMDVTGNTAYLIRTSGLIQELHEFIKEELIKNGIKADFIFPPLHNSSPEKSILGFFKKKKQDILVKNDKDILLSINVRSQLSSIQKNYDTLFERLSAESLNIHEKLPSIPCGYLYLLPTVGYSSNEIKKHKIVRNEAFNWEKYLHTFNLLANRQDIKDKPYKYEKICLLAVDFSENPPRILSSTKDFLALNLISKTFADNFDYTPLKINDFVDVLINAYNSRHPNPITSL